MAKIAVIGAGVIGLSTAYSLKRYNENLDITLIADKFSPDTTSDVAAGIYMIDEGDKGMKNTNNSLLRQWGTETYNWYMEIVKTDNAPVIGISPVSGYMLSDAEELEANAWVSIVPSMQLSKGQLKEFGEDVRSGIFATTFVCENRRYLPWLLERFKEKKGKVLRKKISNFEELSSYDVIVNCSGVGARDLCNDDELQPLRGQVARVKAPWIKLFYHIHYSQKKEPHVVYIIPNIDNTVLGGTKHRSSDLRISDEDRKTILNRTTKIAPSLKESIESLKPAGLFFIYICSRHAEIIGEWVGIRPSRVSVRLEKENLWLSKGSRNESKQVMVVHNYGHGPCGVTLHWGCAQHAVDLVNQCLMELGSTQTKSKL